jgi:hypothetical protein
LYRKNLLPLLPCASRVKRQPLWAEQPLWAFVLHDKEGEPWR